MTFIHDIKLPETSEFSKKFNEVSAIWQESQDPNKTEQERKELQERFYSMKYCLEQGII